MFRGIDLNSTVKNVMGTAMLPGWSEVLNRQSGAMEPCTSANCPLASVIKGPNNTVQLVNRVRLTGFTDGPYHPYNF